MGPRLDAEESWQQQVTRLVRDALLELIQPVELVSVKPNRATGAVSGQFKSKGTLFNYSIKKGRVHYSPASAGRGDSKNWSPARRAGYHEVMERLDGQTRMDSRYCTDFACIEHPDAPAMRSDEEEVAGRAIDVVEALGAVSRAWDRMTPQARALAQQAAQQTSIALVEAGVNPEHTHAEAV